MKKNRNIQGLRAIAFLLIFFSHSCFLFNSNGKNVFSYMGAFGVEIFLMLSGFLADSFFNEKESGIQRVKRTLRKIWPLHIITLIVAIPLCFENSTLFLVKIIVNLFLLQSWIPYVGVYYSLNAVSWYLSVYVFLILCSPYIVKVVRRLSLKYVLWILLVLFMFEIIWCYEFSSLIPLSSHWLIYICPLVRMFDFVGGILISRISKKICETKYSKKILLLYTICGWMLGCILLIASNFFDDEVFLTVAWFIPSALIIYSIPFNNNNQSNCSKVYSNRILVFIGDISMELFLVHQLAILYIEKITDKFTVDRNVFFYILALLLSIAGSVILKKIRSVLLIHEC